MVKIAIAGASGELSREILDKLVETGKHEIVALVRSDPKSFPTLPGVQWIQTKYDDKSELVQLLSGVHTVLCFFLAHKDLEGASQKRLIDAAIEAGVKRYAASEWAIGAKLQEIVDVAPWYASKLDVRAYLEEVNREKRVLEYTLFQPGLFMNYLGYPHQTTKHISISALVFDLNDMRVIAVEKYLNSKIAFTTIADIVAVVARAIEYEGEWPVVGGIAGSHITIGQLLELGERIRGKPFNVEWVTEEDLQAGILKTSWTPPLNHPALKEFSDEERDAFIKTSLIGILISFVREAWMATDEWNQLLPDYKFTSLESFLQQVWGQE